MDAHKDQRRKTGEPYIYHPIEVAKIVANEIGLGATSIACALLHDVIEDSEYTYEDLNKIFGNEMDYTGSEFFVEFLLNPGKFWNFDGIYRILAESLKG